MVSKKSDSRLKFAYNLQPRLLLKIGSCSQKTNQFEIMAIYPAGAWVDAMHPSLGGNSVFSFREIRKYFFRKYKSELHIFLEMLSGLFLEKWTHFNLISTKLYFTGHIKI